jgi:hypothetical protein
MKPTDIERIEIVTATTKPIPMTITRDAPTRSGRARNPIAVTATICLIPVNMAAPSLSV